MWPVSAAFLAAVRYPYVRLAKATHRNPLTGTLTDLPIEDGTVTVDATSRTRRVLSLTCPPQQGLWDVLDVPGGEITVTQTIRFPDHTYQTVPLGVFVVDQDRVGYAPGDTLELTAPDRWVKVQRARFTLNRASIPANAAWQEIKRLVEQAWSGSVPFPGWSQLDTSATGTVGTLLWADGDREKAITDIADARSVEVFFDAAGLAVLRPIPTLTTTSAPVWTVNEGADGVMVAADRTRDRSVIRNAVVVTGTATDAPVAPVLVSDTTAGDPLAVAGPLGTVPEYFDSPLIRTSAQAAAAGKTRLAVTLGEAKQLSMETTGNPALDARDVIAVVLPATDANMPRPRELHILDAVTHPLTPSGTQTARTRSTRPDTDGTVG